MQQQISVVTLGVRDLERSMRFYVGGFGWMPIFQNDEIVFYQMNGFVLGTFKLGSLEQDMGRSGLRSPGAFSLAHNVAEREDVQTVMRRLVEAGGSLVREADAPPHGGFRGYVADPDDHAWEIAWNPAWAIDENGLVTFGL
ncbi:VOC family protein [Pseudaminobacter soli (ex Li et al. 2025)]|uniref:Glyoxalase n=1 Tax=Pseudaminobacter soli (ex Li et al. 2025) TaxID=1295366 RepID=A0A2P7S742_9HYPH|nr:VOC family protein [Mesorhizobium soli]PSJ58267.1 glyoxalase [Mesorhizobium soli]